MSAATMNNPQWSDEEWQQHDDAHQRMKRKLLADLTTSQHKTAKIQQELALLQVAQDEIDRQRSGIGLMRVINA